VSGAGKRVRLDLNSPEFQDVFFRLEAADLKQVVASLRRLTELDWNTLYRHSGFKWEAIRHIKAPGGANTYSLRLSHKIRAITYRDDDSMRLLSLHPDHEVYNRAISCDGHAD
jgi:hypothetical protein